MAEYVGKRRKPEATYSPVRQVMLLLLVFVLLWGTIYLGNEWMVWIFGTSS